MAIDTKKVRMDFDEIARLSGPHDEGADRYDSFLLSEIPADATSVLDVGCGLGRLTARLVEPNRRVLGIDVSPEMITRAQQKYGRAENILFVCDDFLAHDFGSARFACIVTAAALHHVRMDLAIPRLIELTQSGGRLIVHDVRADDGLSDWSRSHAALAQAAFARTLRTGWPLSPRSLRQAWKRHCAEETYLTATEARALADKLLPGARVYNHWLWRYTIVWDKPSLTAAASRFS